VWAFYRNLHSDDRVACCLCANLSNDALIGAYIDRIDVSHSSQYLVCHQPGHFTCGQSMDEPLAVIPNKNAPNASLKSTKASLTCFNCSKLLCISSKDAARSANGSCNVSKQVALSGSDAWSCPAAGVLWVMPYVNRRDVRL
jgi:hypothetical protein